MSYHDPFRQASYGDVRDILDNVEKIRRVLRPGVLVEFHCYNFQEVEDTKARLSEEERKQVRFFWLDFTKAASGWNLSNSSS